LDAKFVGVFMMSLHTINILNFYHTNNFGCKICGCVYDVSPFEVRHPLLKQFVIARMLKVNAHFLQLPSYIVYGREIKSMCGGAWPSVATC
jgi:hypothetical protein